MWFVQGISGTGARRMTAAQYEAQRSYKKEPHDRSWHGGLCGKDISRTVELGGLPHQTELAGTHFQPNFGPAGGATCGVEQILSGGHYSGSLRSIEGVCLCTLPCKGHGVS
jgi:hypothetical protein